MTHPTDDEIREALGAPQWMTPTEALAAVARELRAADARLMNDTARETDPAVAGLLAVGRAALVKADDAAALETVETLTTERDEARKELAALRPLERKYTWAVRRCGRLRDRLDRERRRIGDVLDAVRQALGLPDPDAGNRALDEAEARARSAQAEAQRVEQAAAAEREEMTARVMRAEDERNAALRRAQEADAARVAAEGLAQATRVETARAPAPPAPAKRRSTRKPRATDQLMPDPSGALVIRAGDLRAFVDACAAVPPEYNMPDMVELVPMALSMRGADRLRLTRSGRYGIVRREVESAGLLDPAHVGQRVAVSLDSLRDALTGTQRTGVLTMCVGPKDPGAPFGSLRVGLTTGGTVRQFPLLDEGSLPLVSVLEPLSAGEEDSLRLTLETTAGDLLEVLTLAAVYRGTKADRSWGFLWLRGVETSAAGGVRWMAYGKGHSATAGTLRGQRALLHGTDGLPPTVRVSVDYGLIALQRALAKADPTTGVRLVARSGAVVATCDGWSVVAPQDEATAPEGNWRTMDYQVLPTPHTTVTVLRHELETAIKQVGKAAVRGRVEFTADPATQTLSLLTVDPDTGHRAEATLRTGACEVPTVRHPPVEEGAVELEAQYPTLLLDVDLMLPLVQALPASTDMVLLRWQRWDRPVMIASPAGTAGAYAVLAPVKPLHEPEA